MYKTRPDVSSGKLSDRRARQPVLVIINTHLAIRTIIIISIIIIIILLIIINY